MQGDFCYLQACGALVYSVGLDFNVGTDGDLGFWKLYDCAGRY